MSITIITCSGEMINLVHTDMPLSMAQSIVGGLVEVAIHQGGNTDETDTGNGMQMLVNEEGRLVKLSPNIAASKLAGMPIKGIALVLTAEHMWD
jgi:hypothetical protein